jgi:flagellar assembly factor FliW
MRVSPTKYWGELRYNEDAVIRFARGIYGFEDHGEFILIQQAGLEPMVFFQSLRDAGLCLPALPVKVVCPDYRLSVRPEELAALGLDPEAAPRVGEGLACFAVVRVHEDGVPTANLLAPLVIALAQGRGVQAIAEEGSYSHQHPVEAPVPC